MKSFFVACMAAAAIVSVAGNARADDFQLNAIPNDGSTLMGNLTFSVDLSNPTTPGGDQYSDSNGALTAFDFTINGVDFDLADELGNTFVTVDNGEVTGVDYIGAAPDADLDNVSTAALTYSYGNLAGAESSGVLSSTVAVPEPASMSLLFAGMAGLAFLRRRKAI